MFMTTTHNKIPATIRTITGAQIVAGGIFWCLRRLALAERVEALVELLFWSSREAKEKAERRPGAPRILQGP